MYRLYMILTLLACLTTASYDSFAADATKSVNIERSGFVLNRSTKTYDAVITITNISQTSLMAPINVIVTLDNAGVSVSNKSGSTADGKPYIQFPSVASALNQGQAATVTLKISNPGQIAFSASLAIDAQFSFGSVPPDPGPNGKLTLAGIDSNNNGIRDDVEIFIARTYGASQRVLAALNQFSISAQRAVLSTTVNESLAIGGADDRALECLYYLKVPRDAWKSVLAMTLNTPDRFRAYAAYNTRLVSGSFPSSTEDFKLSCAFDPDALPN